jgi:hypothetical protein
VLDNVRETVRLHRPKMVGSVRDLARYLGRPPTIAEALDYFDTCLDELLKRGLWSRLLADAGAGPDPVAPDADRLEKGLRRLAHIDDPERIRWLRAYLDTGLAAGQDGRLLDMLHVTLWGDQSTQWSVAEADARLRQNPAVVADLRQILDYRLAHAPALPAGRVPEQAGPLTIHAQYTRDEILVGLGRWTLARRPDVREGVLHLPESRVDAFFVTLQKTEDEYSPTTMYEDYLISHDLFHWQSQSTTSADSPTGTRYVRHREQGYTPLLFVRETRTLAPGFPAPYAFLGPCKYVSHEGSRPMSIVWRLRHPVPARLFRVMAWQSAS